MNSVSRRRTIDRVIGMRPFQTLEQTSQVNFGSFLISLLNQVPIDPRNEPRAFLCVVVFEWSFRFGSLWCVTLPQVFF
jgi:hypothetical protein